MVPGEVTTIHLIAAARPNFMKIAPLYHALSAELWCEPRIVHTGQHYDSNMSDAFFSDLGLPHPHHHLGVGSGTHAEQTGGVMVAYEKVCFIDRPDWIVVAGDVNSTIACALVGAKLLIPVAHLEAGLRSGDRSMPEEINRILTDAISALLWTPSQDANENLIAEGVAAEKIDFVGNIMIDSYAMLKDKIQAARTTSTLELIPGEFGVVTLHRPSNVDHRETLRSLLEQLAQAARFIPLVFAVHPRTRKSIDEFGLQPVLVSAPGLKCVEPLGYVEFMNLVERSRFVLTDSGGVQEETTYLGIPCITLRDTTERPVTVTIGTNELVRHEDLLSRIRGIVDHHMKQGAVPKLWDGNTAARVVASLRQRCASQ